MAICCALIKHDYSNFSISILEYCEPSKCLIREKHYWNIFNPEYNIAKDPTAPMRSRNHSDETKQILSDAKKGENHPNYGKTLNDETKTKISDAMIGLKRSDKTKKIISDAKKGQPRPSGAGKPSKSIEVFDLQEKTMTTYNSISEAARALNINYTSIVMYFSNNQTKPYKGQYTFKKL